VVASIEEHPLAALHRAGVSVTVSTDDRTVTGVTLSEELARCVTDAGLSRAELASVSLNAFGRAFAPPALLAALTAEARRAWEGWVTEPLQI
jgi:adenosine deaminase